VDCDCRYKWDPRADGRTANPGEIVEAWVRWHCPDDSNYWIKTGVVNATGDGIEYVQVTRTSWNVVRTYFQQNYGVTLPAQVSCPGYV
jgi:hypothetical protein